MNHVVTSTLVFDAPGTVNEYVGGYDDWLRQKEASTISKQEAPIKSPAVVKNSEPSPKSPQKSKLSYNEQRELGLLPVLIEKLESEQEDIHAQMADSDFYNQDSLKITQIQERLTVIQVELEQSYKRWEDLDS